MKEKLSSWESQARSIARIVIGLMITLHGLRNVFEILPPLRRNAPRLALDTLGSTGGYVELVGGVLLMLGLLTIPVAAILALTAAAGYIAGPISRPSPWPIRNGGEEAVVYVVVAIYFALAGAGVWSIDALLHRAKPTAPAV